MWTRTDVKIFCVFDDENGRNSIRHKFYKTRPTQHLAWSADTEIFELWKCRHFIIEWVKRVNWQWIFILRHSLPVDSAFSTLGNILFHFHEIFTPSTVHQPHSNVAMTVKARFRERESTFSLRRWLALKFINNSSLLLLLTAETHHIQNILNKLYWDLNFRFFIVEKWKCLSQSFRECQTSETCSN